MIKRTIKFFDRLEDKIRGYLSKHLLAYSFIGGFSIVVFWRGVWEVFDSFEIFDDFSGGMISIAISSTVMLLTGLFVSFFVGDRIILSGLKRERKLEEKTFEELEKEGDAFKSTVEKLDRIEKKIIEIEKKLNSL